MTHQLRRPASNGIYLPNRCRLWPLTLLLTSAFFMAKPAFGEILGTESFELEDGSTLQVEVGEVSVPENRSKSDSRDIRVGFFRIESEQEGQTTPTFVLPGGPGGSYTKYLAEDGRRRAFTTELVNLYRQRGDVVLVDLRGIGRSTPSTVCEGARNKWRFINSKADFLEILADSAQACREKLLEEGFDLAGYTVMEAAADVVAIADSLGYGEFRLHGTSFGSHWAMTVMRYHGERVERAVISGVESYDHTYDDPRGLRTAAEMISEMASATWQADGRDGNPLQELDALLEKAQASPEAAHGLEPYLVSTLALTGQDFSLTSRDRLTKWPQAAAELADGEVWLAKTFIRFL
ncbi:MAG: alpha/beta fold hydrolase, partial [Pseudomonadota bacterium]